MTEFAFHLHDSAPLAPHDLWTAWSWEPGVILGLGAAWLQSESRVARAST